MDDAYFGSCPKCHQGGAYLNDGPEHWNICESCKTKWLIGWNLFSSWKDETEADWEKNRGTLAALCEVRPYYRPSGRVWLDRNGKLTVDAARG